MGITRQRRGLLVGVAVLGFTLAGLAIAQVVSQGLNPSSNGADTPTGTLVSDEGAANTALDRARCWDGSSAIGVVGCGEPSGLTGLVWVFPSLEPDSCEAAGNAGGRWRMSCSITTRSGAEAVIVYRELFSVTKGLTYYTREYADGLAERKQRGRRYYWRATGSDARGLWQISAMYVDQPWSVHVESETKKGARQAFESIEFRLVGELRGVPSSR